MIFNLKMFEAERDYAVVRSVGYESILRHSHEFVELVYVVSGTAVQKVNGESSYLQEGDMFVIADRSVEHYIRPTCEEKKFRLINIIFRPDFVAFDYSVFRPIMPLNTLHNPSMKRMVDFALQEYEERGHYVNEMVKGVVYLLLSNLAKMYTSRSESRTQKNRNAVYMMQAVRYIAENFAEKLKLDDIAKHVGLSPGYLQKIFKKERNTSVIEYLLRYRVEQSCKLLIETEKSISDISDSIGFSDVKNFYYAFKKVIGMTPNEYRQTHRNRVAVVDSEGERFAEMQDVIINKKEDSDDE